jgi:beta-lactamase superfamily II metal-dependent hydrolase
MKLRVFHAADGDCLLLSTDDEQHHMLVDGGRKGTFEANTRAHLAQLHENDKMLDVICVSHVDNDHISGILQLVEDEVAWRRFKFEKASDPNTTPPSVRLPPRIGQIWHNALFRLIGEDLAPQVESALATSASILAGSDDEDIMDLASRYENLATGEKAAMELSRRISAEQLAIPLNEPAGGDLMKRGGPGETVQIGSMKLSVLGPSDDDLEALRTEWDKWLKKNEAAIAHLHSRMLADEQNLGTLSPVVVANPIAAALGEGLSGITEPNLASLMLFVEEGDQTVLLAGDGESGEILQGLAHHGKLDAHGRIHVTVLKVQHHGALANVTREFVDHVTADHYVFCGNGAHHNPEMEVVEEFARARLDHLDTEFKFWFTSSSATPGLSEKRKMHMEEIENQVDTLIANSGGLMKAEFIPEGHFDVL